VDFLVEKGVDASSWGGFYGNALHAASHKGHELVVHLLLKNGANVNAQGGHLEMLFWLHHMRAIKLLWTFCSSRGQIGAHCD
jgi:Ankyrin repeat